MSASPGTHLYLSSKVPKRSLRHLEDTENLQGHLRHLCQGCNPPLTCYGKIEILEVLDLPGALAGSQTLIKGLEEVGKGQLHVRDARPPVLTIVRPHSSDEKALETAKSLQIVNAGEVVEKREPSYTFGGNVNWCNHYGEQYGGPLEN